MEIETFRSLFRDWLINKRPYSEATLDLYVRHGVRVYRAFEAGKTPQDWLAGQLKPGAAKGTITSYLAAARRTWEFLGSEAYQTAQIEHLTFETGQYLTAGHVTVEDLPDRGPRPEVDVRVRAWKKQDVTPRPLTAQQLAHYYKVVERLRSVAFTEPNGDERSMNLTVPRKGVLLLLGCTGIRISALCAVEVEHLTRQEGEFGILVKRAKGRKTRWVPLSPFGREVLQAYLPARQQWLKEAMGSPAEAESPYLFPAASRPKPDERGRLVWSHEPVPNIQWILRAMQSVMPPWWTELGVSSHTFRHTYGSLLEASGASIRQIQDILGHESIKTTQRYTQPNAGTLAQAVKGFSLPSTD